MSRPSKKRALMPSLETTELSHPTPAAAATVRRSSSDSAAAHYYVDASIIYKAELEHERSLRTLDAKRSLQQQQRLEKLVEFSQEELDQCKQMLEEERQHSDLHMEQLRQARDDAMDKCRDLQQQQHGRHRTYDDDDDDSSRNSEDGGAPQDALWQRKYHLLQSHMQGKDVELDQVRLQLQAVQSLVQESLLEERHTNTNAPGTPPPQGQGRLLTTTNVGQAASPAPAELLHELNRIRIELAESNRTQRQLRRTAEEWQTKAKQLLPEREAARALQGRVHILERHGQETSAAYQMARAENEEWQHFGKSLSQHFPASTSNNSSTNAVAVEMEAHNYKNPPEVTTILRHVEQAKQQLVEAQDSNKVLESRVEKLKDWKRPAEARIKSNDEKEGAWLAARQELEQRLDSQQRQVDTLQKQEGIWKREIASLQELLQSFDHLPISAANNTTSAAAALATAALDAKLKTVKLELASTTEELQLVRADRDRVQQECATVVKERREQRQELDRVKEKYGKLREALEVQKSKAQEAEARAHRAEELSGMGSFNPNETRVLHLSQNPLSDTLRQRNVALKKQLQEALQAKRGEATPARAKAASTPQSEVNPDKLHQRLKQSFKEQIGLFREGVYLMTGYKIDMLPGVDRPTFRVRSMYAGREEDHLMLKWPKLPDGESVRSLDLLGTEWAKVLSRSPSYDYMTKFSSLPAFLASVQLSEFEKQTIMS